MEVFAAVAASLWLKINWQKTRVQVSGGNQLVSSSVTICSCLYRWLSFSFAPKAVQTFSAAGVVTHNAIGCSLYLVF